jgi:hypothetical protein
LATENIIPMPQNLIPLARHLHRARLLCFGLVFPTFVLGCDGDELPPRQKVAPSGAVPEAVKVGAQRATLGTHLGQLRNRVEVAAFKIAKRPVSVAEYKQCVDAGGCAKPSATWPACQPDRGVDGATFSASGSAANAIPLTCATPEEASKYCEWVGGTLPRGEQLLLAARGPEVKKYAWGSAPLSCELHWRQSKDTDAEEACCGSTCSSLSESVLGTRPAGASPLGLEDVLVTWGELIASSTSLHECRGKRGCVLTASSPGALDNVLPLPEEPADDDQSVHVPAASFRCVWGVEQ